jgi:hypothetical protein
VFQLAANDGEKLVGVLIAGRPVARMLDNGTTIEVTRCCTDGTRNACSALYGAAWRAAKSLGWSKMVTYTLPEEGGASMRATGARFAGEAGGGLWKHTAGPRSNDHPLGMKHRWEWTAEPVLRIRLESDEVSAPDLFAAIA